jgi:hypothetical protein
MDNSGAPELPWKGGGRSPGHGNSTACLSGLPHGWSNDEVTRIGASARIVLPRSTKEQPDYTVWNATEDISIQELTSSTESLHLGNGVSPHLTKAESATTLARVKRAEIWANSWLMVVCGGGRDASLPGGPCMRRDVIRWRRGEK